MINSNYKNTVIFDFGDTLASTVPTYPMRISIALRNLGFDFTDNEFIDAYHLADYRIYKNYISSGSISSGIYQNTLFDVLRDSLNIESDREELKKLVRDQLKKIDYKRVLLESADEMLELLRRRGFKLAVISNNDGYTLEKCRQLGIGEYFDSVVDSTRVGMVKPDRNIYTYTLNELGAYADEAVHIGDLYGADILGGINSGLDVIWFNHRNAENFEKIEVRQFMNIKDIIETC